MIALGGFAETAVRSSIKKSLFGFEDGVDEQELYEWMVA